MNPLPARPLLALPFTFLTGPNRVRLVAGEDYRFTLDGPDLESWLPGWLPTLDGRQTLDEALLRLPEPRRLLARKVVERLHGERVIGDGPASKVHCRTTVGLELHGSGSLRDMLEAGQQPGHEGVFLSVLCQDSLDYEEALRFNRQSRAGSSPWLWATLGPLTRAYVSPVFLSDAGPCLECLLACFRRLSPLPELYDELRQHVRRGEAIVASPTTPVIAAIVVAIVQAKREWLALPTAPAALFQLHVVESACLEISTHRVFVDAECPACGPPS